MAALSRPDKPLKVLTFDGGGLQAISKLLILDELLETIRRNNNADRKPLPCEVFDVMAGIGPGGWLALFLGRFQLDIPSCLTEWYKLVLSITPRSNGQGFKRKLLHDSYFDIPSLVDNIDRLAKSYGVGSTLIDKDPPSIRCKYVFVAARRERHDHGHTAPRYNLFRTYHTGDKYVLPGPSEPSEFKISSAFAVTGAARYFTSPRKEKVSNNGRISFLDSAFPEPHNVTELAIEEMWGLFGRDVPMSVIVNVSAGLPNKHDMEIIARRFSWRRNLSSPASVTSPISNYQANGHASSDAYTIRRANTNTDYPEDRKLKKQETDIEKIIMEKLKKTYPDNTPPYFRLAPEQSPPGTVQNDLLAPDVALDDTVDFLNQRAVKTKLENAGKRLSDSSQDRGSLHVNQSTSAP